MIALFGRFRISCCVYAVYKLGVDKKGKLLLGLHGMAFKTVLTSTGSTNLLTHSFRYILVLRLEFLWIPSRSSYVYHLKLVFAALEMTFGTISALIKNQPYL